MTDREPTRARHLGDAIEAYLQHRAGSVEADPLDAHPTLGEWLGPMLAGAEDGDGIDHGLDLLGDFRLVREVGRGGMGVVFEAIQQSLDRRVALKVLAANRNGSPRSIERFRREANAAAKLRHPSIVQVFGVGELGGHHVLAMEFVDGPNLAERLEHQRSLPLAQRRIAGDLDERGHVVQVADLVARLADALAYAHENGVVHRDVKPHNVLLLRDGTPKLVDFGVAKVTDALSLSHTRELIGTPHYMSPEQAAGGDSADPRSDVFSLGVVVYELLTFTRPFDGTTADHVLQAIRNAEPVPMRDRDARIPRELDLICGRALEKDPRERYASAAALAADLRSFLRHEPISVEPPGPLRRARKLLSRHRAAAVVTAIVAAGAALAYGLAAEWRRAGVDAERVQTERAEQFAFGAVQEFLGLLEEWLPRTAAADTAGRDRIREAVRLYETYLDEARVERGLRAAVASVSMQVGAVYRELGLPAEAEAAYARSTDLWQALIDEDGSGDAVWHGLADAWRARTGLAHQQLDADAARAAYAADRAARQVVLDRSPDDETARVGLAKTHTNRGRGMLHGLGSLAEARVALEAANGLWRGLTEQFAADPTLRLAAQQTRAGLAHLEHHAGRYTAAIAAFEALLAELDADQAVMNEVPWPWLVHRAECELGLADAWRRAGERGRAEDHLCRAIEIHDTLRRELPGRPDLRQRSVSLRALFGTLLQDRGDIAGARRELALAIEDARALLDRTPADVKVVLQFANLQNRVAATHFRGDAPPPDDVLACYRDALGALARCSADPEAPVTVLVELGATHGNLAAAHLLRSDFAPARQHVDLAIQAQRKAVDADPERTTSRGFLRAHHLLRAQVLLKLGRVRDAVAAVETSVNWVVDPRTLRPIALVLEQCADAATDATHAAAWRTRAAELRRDAASRRPER